MKGIVELLDVKWTKKFNNKMNKKNTEVFRGFCYISIKKIIENGDSYNYIMKYF